MPVNRGENVEGQPDQDAARSTCCNDLKQSQYRHEISGKQVHCRRNI
jgi:hypothetical protein